MADEQRKKHRHDLGQEDHGPKVAAGTTRTIQTLLGLWIALTVGLVVYAMIDATRVTGVGGVGDVPSQPSSTLDR